MYYRSADLFVLPSRGEGMPNTLLEAMSCGVPVVASAIGGVVDVITNEETGFLVPPGDHVALARSIVKALSGDGAALGARGRKTVTDRFSLDAVTEGYTDLYGSLLDV
jgi:glycosyltransferase involved in cell wall biosynthesis